ncbi:Laccase-3 [Bienertia sinuspersici]
MELHRIKCSIFLGLSIFFAFSACLASAAIHHHNFVIRPTPVKRLCNTHDIMTVNGQFPGPTLEVRNGDTVIIKATNAGKYNITLHWHGMRQMRTPWADGPEFVTQCPIRPGGTYTYRFTIEDQEGTLWWHAHSKWMRATVYGALVIYPKLGSSYPFPKPAREYPIILGEWWNRDPMQVLQQATMTGAGANVSDAYTINAQPGDLYPCSGQVFPVKTGETILLRIINAALNQQLFFSIANHQMTVVEADASYTKPFTTNVVMIGPGQTTNVLITANQPSGRYYMAATAYSSAPGVPFANTTTTAILEYNTRNSARPILPRLPPWNDTNTANSFTSQFRSISKVDVPLQIDDNLFFTVNLGPPVQFDYTGNVSRGLWTPMTGTKLYKLKFGSHVQVVLQNTNIFTIEDHPMHLHGYHFYVVGTGKGNFDPKTDPAKFNLVDPPFRNTVGTTPGGVWLMHCHLDVHIGWGLAMVFLVENGVGKLQSLEPPPPDLPQC